MKMNSQPPSRGRMLRRSLPVIALFLAITAVAEEGTRPWMEHDRSSMLAGLYRADFDTKVRLTSGPLNRGSIVDLEDDFGLDDTKNRLVLHADHRFRARHRIDGTYYDLSRSGSKVLERDIDFGDISFPEGSTVDTNFDYRVLKLTYSYSLFQNRSVDLAISGGIYVADFDLRSTNRETGEFEGEDGVAPFPMFGVRGTWLAGPRLTVDLYAEYFEVDNSDAEGSYLDMAIMAGYHFTESWTGGIAYARVDVEGEDKSSDDEASFDYNGALIFLEYRFN